jgi:hypothetical protein
MGTFGHGKGDKSWLIKSWHGKDNFSSAQDRGARVRAVVFGEESQLRQYWANTQWFPGRST